MNTIVVIVHDKNSIFTKPTKRVFEYDPAEFTSSPEAMLYVEQFMAMGYSITTEVLSEDRERGSRFINNTLPLVGHGYPCA